MLNARRFSQLRAADPTFLQDLEQIEEWNEFGELRMVVNSVQDLGGMPATSYPLPATDSLPASTPREPEPAPPKPSTIRIQSPPSTSTEEKKDEQAVLALRQASTEAASKAKTKSDEKQVPLPKEEVKEGLKKDGPESDAKEADPAHTTRTHRGSVAPELPDTTPDSPKGVKRPPLVPEVAAVSSANFHADNAEALGLVEHHRGSIISTTDKAEQEKVVHEIRQSISAEEPSGSLKALREEAAQKGPSETIVEEGPISALGENENFDAKAEATAAPTDDADKEGPISAQDPKSTEQATVSVKD